MTSRKAHATRRSDPNWRCFLWAESHSRPGSILEITRNGPLIAVVARLRLEVFAVISSSNVCGAALHFAF